MILLNKFRTSDMKMWPPHEKIFFFLHKDVVYNKRWIELTNNTQLMSGFSNRFAGFLVICKEDFHPINKWCDAIWMMMIFIYLCVVRRENLQGSTLVVEHFLLWSCKQTIGSDWYETLSGISLNFWCKFLQHSYDIQMCSNKVWDDSIKCPFFEEIKKW